MFVVVVAVVVIVFVLVFAFAVVLVVVHVVVVVVVVVVVAVVPSDPRSRAFFQTYSPMEIGCLCAFRTLGVRFRVSGGGGCFCSHFVH